jgi:hypothetical protein
MKKYTYVDYDGTPITVTEDEIIDQFFEEWSTTILDRFPNHSLRREDCIGDFVWFNNAWESK